jgi:hypothetical protein
LPTPVASPCPRSSVLPIRRHNVAAPSPRTMQNPAVHREIRYCEAAAFCAPWRMNGRRQLSDLALRARFHSYNRTVRFGVQSGACGDGSASRRSLARNTFLVHERPSAPRSSQRSSRRPATCSNVPPSWQCLGRPVIMGVMHDRTMTLPSLHGTLRPIQMTRIQCIPTLKSL